MSETHDEILFVICHLYNSVLVNSLHQEPPPDIPFTNHIQSRLYLHPCLWGLSHNKSPSPSYAKEGRRILAP
ncbi:hypothetical protein TgHK011_009971 [Trichoderma gracile]|nr:hypothetical protein TgHK011_009971 [Trichoderma gracile]